MSKISTYEVAPVPKLSDKLIGTSVGGEIEDVTYNFTLQELLDVFLPVIPANNLQGILDYGNTATQDINLFGTITTTNLEVTDTANLFITYLNEETHIVGSVFDSADSVGTAGQVLTSTGEGVEWYTLPPIFTPNLQQVLEVGNTAEIDILLDANIQALDVTSETANVTTQLTIQGTVVDYNESAGTAGQVLESTATGVQWTNLPVYSATSPLLFNPATGVFSIQVANSTQNGYLSSADWITFSGKQNAGSYITALTGEATATGPGSVPITLNNASVINKVLTGLNVTGGSISATDSILTAFGKVQSQINGLMGGVQYQGTWDAATNTPTLTSSVGTQGYYYIVSVDGNTNLNGITDWKVGDWAIFSGGTWQKVDNTDSVTSVNGFTGAVSLTTDNIPEGTTNLYFLNSRARAAVSATSPLLYNNTTGVFSIQQASGIQNGFLSSTDWTTFNSKQDYLNGTGLVKSTAGTITYITDNSSNWNTAYNRSLTSAAVTGTGTKTLTLNQQDGGTITASWSDADTGLTSVGLSMPSAFTVSNSPLTSNGTIGVTGAGTTAQYVRGDGSLATFPSIISEAQNLVTEVYNSSGATLTKGTVVYINGGQGNLPTITKAIATSDATSAQTYGVVRSDITNMNNGYVVVAGRLGDLDTRDYTPGQQLYLSSTTAGAWTPTKQYAPNHLVYIAIVVRAHPTQGVVEVMIQNGYEMDELHNVAAQNPDNNDILQYKTSTNLWTKVAGTTTNIAEGTNLYYLDSRARAALSFTPGSGAYNSTTGVITIPTNTNQLTNGAAFITLGSLSASAPLSYNNTTGAFSISQSNSTTDGYLSSTDWNTFNNKQPAGSYVPTSRLLSINGTQYDLSADRSWSVGTVTSVAALTLGTSGIDLSSSVANGTTTPVITLNVPTASAANRGALSAADWSTFNTKVGSVTASSPLASSGGSTPNITIQQASGSQNGYLSSTDWTTFNNKQAAGNYITSLTGEATATGPGAASVTLNNASVTGKVLTGVNITGGSISASDSILTAFGKVQNQINGLIGSTIYQGTWNAATNTPALASGVGTRGYYYIVNVAGTTNLDGITDWFVGDWAIFDGTAWQQVDNTDAVVSVNGQTGAVSLTTDNIPEGATNQYFLNSRARAALSFTAGSGAYNSTTGVITIPTNNNQITNGANYITLASLSGVAPIQYNSSTGAISITQAGSASNGFLSSTDWNTFNNKQSIITLTTTGTSGAATLVGNTLNIPQYQSVITNPVTGTGTTNYVSKWTSSSAIGNSQIFDNGTNVSVGTSSVQSGTKLLVAGVTDIWSSANTLLRLNHDGTRGVIETFTGGGYGQTLINPNGGNVGIGVTNPLAKLHAGMDMSDIHLQTFTNTGAIITSVGVDQTAARTNVLSLMRDGTNAVVYAGLAAFDMSRWQGGDTYTKVQLDLRLSNLETSDLVDVMTWRSNGFVGIGTTSPANILEITAVNSNVYPKVNRTSAAYEAGWKLSTGGTDTWYLGLRSADGTGSYHFYSYTTNTSVASITNDGNLLINTTTDAGYKLDVNGTGRFSSSVTATSFSVSNGSISNSGFWGMQNIAGTGTFADWALLNSATTRIMHNPTGTTNMVFNGTVTATKGYFSSNGATDSSTALLANASTNDSTTYAAIFGSLNAGYRMVVRGDGAVGIGINSPSYKLSIQGNAGIEASEEYFYFNSSYSVGSNARAKIRAVGTGGGSGYGGDFRVSTRATNNVWNEDAFVVDYLGRAGIGTTSPAQKLDVSGNIRATGTQFYLGATASGDTVITLYSQNNSYSEIRSNAGAGSGYNGIMISSNYNAANSLPSWSIDLGGCLNSTSNVNAYTLGYRPNGGSWSSYMVVNSSGNFGIATATINNFRLNVAGHYSAETGSYFTDGAGDSYRAGIGWQSTANPSAVLSTLITTINDGNYGGHIVFLNRGNNGGNLNERARVASNGNFGIGCTNPLAKLQAGMDVSDVSTQTFTNTGAIITSVGVDQTASRTNVLSLMRDGTSSVVYAGLSAFDMSRWQADGVNTRVQLDLRLSNTDTADLVNVMSWRSNGFVGIGTTTPNNIVDIQAVNSNVYPKVNRSSASYEAGWKYATGGTDSWYIGLRAATNTGSYHFYSYTTNSSVVQITNGGNVLIGTTTDNGYTLQNAGNTTFTGQFVQGGGTGRATFGTTIAYAGNSSTIWSANSDPGDGGRFFSIVNQTSTTNAFSAVSFRVNPDNAGSSGNAMLDMKFVNNGSSISTLYWTFLTSGGFSDRMSLTNGGALTAVSFFESSDSRLKTLIKDDYRALGIESVKARLYLKEGRQEIGYYAQDLESILPSAVSKNDAGFLSLSYTQVHTAKIAIIEDEVDVLKRRVTELESKLQKYEA
jgi:hypothetical protein